MKSVTIGQERKGTKNVRISHENDALELKIYCKTFDGQAFN